MQAHHIIWETARRELAGQAAPLWLGLLYARAFENGTLILQETEEIDPNQLQKTALPTLEYALFQATGNLIPVIILPVGEKETNGLAAHTFDTFERFLTVPGNKFSVAAAESAMPHSENANPLFLYSPYSYACGKTHLLFAIANDWKEERPDRRVLYRCGHTLLNEVAVYHAEKREQVMADRYGRADLILLDDVHVFAGKELLQEALFQLIDSLCRSGKQVVLASSRSPQDTMILYALMQEQLPGCLCTDIQPLKPQEIRQIIKKRLTEMGITAQDAALDVVEEQAEVLSLHPDRFCKAWRVIQRLYDSEVDCNLVWQAIHLMSTL